MTICVINQKGGVGKSTTVITLARLMADESPLILDLDDQRMTMRYQMDGVRVKPVRADTIEAALEVARGGPIIIDCPPLIETAVAALDVATHIIVPCECAPDAVATTVKFCASLSRIYSETPLKVLITKYNAVSMVSRRSLRDLQREFGDQAFKTVIAHKMIMSEAAAAEKSIIDFAPDSQSAKQYRKLFEEIQKWQ